MLQALKYYMIAMVKLFFTSYIKIHPLSLGDLWRGELRNHRSAGGKKRRHEIREHRQNSLTWQKCQHTLVWGAPLLLINSCHMRGKDHIIKVNRGVFIFNCENRLFWESDTVEKIKWLKAKLVITKQKGKGKHKLKKYTSLTSPWIRWTEFFGIWSFFLPLLIVAKPQG